MTTIKISQLPAATQPIAGTSVAPVVQGSTTVKATVQQIRQFVSVADYGATGDNTTDDTAAIQAALTASTAVDFGGPDKTYKITDTLVCQNNQFIQASGATIRQATSQKAIFDIRNLSNITAIGLKHQGFRTDYVNSSLSLAIGYRAANAINVVIRDCEFKWFAYSPVYGEAMNGFKFINNTVIGPGLIADGGCLNPTATPTITRNNMGVTVGGTNIQVSDNRISLTAQGVYITQGSNGVVVSNNVIFDILVEHGMYIDAGIRRLTVADNVVRNTYLNGIKVQWYNAYATDVSDIVITGNVVEDAGTVGAGGDGIIVLNSDLGSGVGITAVTKANPGVITTASAHSLAVDDIVYISGVGGMTQLQGFYYVNTTPSTTQFTVKTYEFVALDTSGFTTYTSGGSVIKPIYGKNIVIANNSVRNVEQDGISLRYVLNAAVTGNVVVNTSRIGIAYVEGENCLTANNNIRDIAENGIFFFGALQPSQIKSNALYNTGSAGIDTNARSSGMNVYGDGGVDIAQNYVVGEPTQTKMQYGIYVTQGDKTQYSVTANTVFYAQDAGARFHADTNDPLKICNDNLFAAATGAQVIAGINELVASIPQRGAIYPPFTGNNAPASGSWLQGDVVWALYPAAGAPLGWVCAVAGSPGTWIPFGAVQSVNAYTVTNPSTDRALNVTGDTTAQVAAVLGTLIADLQAAGVLKS